MKSKIFEHLDYRAFLKERFNELKSQNPHFSFRYFNRLAGIKSAGFLKLVMDGKRNLGAIGIQKIIKGFKLDPQEALYFEKLVEFNQAKDHEEKARHFEELYTQKINSKQKEITAAQYHLFSRWYYVAILELLRLTKPKRKTASWLSQNLLPKVNLRETKAAVKELKKLGLVTESKTGHLTRHETMLATPDAVASLFVTNFHQEMSALASQAVKNQNAAQREFSALTVALSEDNFKRFKKELRSFRKTLHALSEQTQGQDSTKVAQVNLQLFQLNQT